MAIALCSVVEHVFGGLAEVDGDAAITLLNNPQTGGLPGLVQTFLD